MVIFTGVVRSGGDVVVHDAQHAEYEFDVLIARYRWDLSLCR
jgi:hypothetical protein